MRRTVLKLAALALAAIGAVTVHAQTASTPFPVPTYYASAFGQWAILSQNPNVFVFPGRTVCNSAGQNTNFFVFNTNAPVFILDSNSANNEVVTPTTVVNNAGQCGFTGTTVNNHYSFQVKSGTGGLQEALNTIAGGATNPALLVLDRNWYAMANGVPSTTAQAILAAAVGSASIIIEDITTAPATYYTANSAGKYFVSQAPAVLPNLKVSSYTNIAAPTALTTVAGTCATNGGGCITSTTTGGTIPANSAAYRLGATCVDAGGGETTLSIDTASGAIVTPSGTASTSTISVTSPAGCTTALGAVGWRLYMTAASGATLTEILYSPTCTATQLQSVFPTTTVCAIGSTATISAVVTGTATIPAVSTAYPRVAGASLSWPPFAAGGTLATTVVGELGHVKFPVGWFNTLGRSIEFCGNGYGTTNGTAGTITFSTDFTSVYGVTLITPFTAVSGSIAASAIQVPFDFCVTYTTSATGATGTLETHGCVNYGVAGTAVATVSCDIIFAASSTVDLTKSNTLVFNIKPTTAGLSAYQLRQLTAYPSN